MTVRSPDYGSIILSPLSSDSSSTIESSIDEPTPNEEVKGTVKKIIIIATATIGMAAVVGVGFFLMAKSDITQITCIGVGIGGGMGALVGYICVVRAFINKDHVDLRRLRHSIQIDPRLEL